MKALSTRNKWLYAVALLIAVVLVYLPGLSGSFFFDDRPNITDNPALQLFDGSLRSLLWATSNAVASPLGRPLSMASFALNLHFFGPGPFSFKLVNLLIHLANGALVYLFARQLLQRFAAAGNARLAAFWVCAVWLLHPINLAPVLFVVQRMTSLAALFTLAALVLYLHGRLHGGARGRGALAGAVLVCWPLALMCKETALLFPLYVLALECLALDSLRTVAPRYRWLGALILALAASVLAAAAWSRVGASYAFRDFTLAERLMTEARVLWFHVLQMTLPWPGWFSLYHDDFAVSRSLWSPWETLPAIAAWIGAAALAFHYRKRAPLAAFALAWFFAAHALESTILPLELAYEHRNYLASFGILLALAGWLFAPRQETEPGGKPILAVAAILACALVTGLRATQWGDEYLRTGIEAARHSHSTRANYEAAVAVMDRTFLGPAGGNEEAYQKVRLLLTRASELDRNGKVPLIGMLFLDCVAGKPKNPALQMELRKRFANTPFSPGDRGTVQSLSELLVEKRLCLDDAEVDNLLKAALSNPAAVGVMRGMIHTVAMDYAAAKLRSLPLALAHAREAVRSDPGAVPSRINLIRLLMAAKEKTEARQEYAALARLPIPPLDQATVAQLGKELDNMERLTHAR